MRGLYLIVGLVLLLVGADLAEAQCRNCQRNRGNVNVGVGVRGSRFNSLSNRGLGGFAPRVGGGVDVGVGVDSRGRNRNFEDQDARIRELEREIQRLRRQNRNGA